MRRWRLIKGVLIFGLLGAIVNLTVAWAIAFWMPMPESFAANKFGAYRWSLTPPNTFPHQARRIGRWEDAGIVRLNQAADADTAEAVIARRKHAESLRLTAASKADGLDTLLDFTLIESAESGYFARVTRTGWPLVAFQGARFEHHRINPNLPLVESIRWATESSGNVVRGVSGDHRRLLPYRPMFTGFVINTALYAVVLWLIVATSLAIIHWRRRQRICLCASCGYDLRGTAHVRCPECGAAIAANT